jgi:hypothetical protein
MKRVLDDIQSGQFARDWMLENKVKLAQHPIEEAGVKLRDMMPWKPREPIVPSVRIPLPPAFGRVRKEEAIAKEWSASSAPRGCRSLMTNANRVHISPRSN